MSPLQKVWLLRRAPSWRTADMTIQGLVCCIKKMVLCAVIGCMNRSDRDKVTIFSRLLTVNTHWEDKPCELSDREQQSGSKIGKARCQSNTRQYTRVCADHILWVLIPTSMKLIIQTSTISKIGLCE